MNKFSTAKICRAGIIASVYFILTYFFQAISFGPIQLRVAEALTILPLFFIESVPALFIGCLIANFFSGFLLFDIAIGAPTTLVAAIITYVIGRLIKNKYLRFILGAIPPILANAFAVPLIILLSGGLEYTYMVQVLIIGAGQALAILPLGGLLYFSLYSLKENNPNSSIFTK